MKISRSYCVLMVILISTCRLYGQTTGYRQYKEMTAHLKSMAEKYPDLLKLASLAKSPEHRDVWVMTVSRGNPTNKPAMLVIGGIETTDIAGSELCLRFLDSLLVLQKNDDIGALLEKNTLYIIPRANPDGVEAFFIKPRYEYRLNSRDKDLDRDGTISEDGYDDLNDDGIISAMRVSDPEGEWCTDEDIPQLLKKAEPGKKCTARYRLFTEGIDNDKDGKINEDEPGGVDISRNFPFGFVHFDAETGDYQLSESESRAVVDFMFDYPNIAAVFSFSQYGDLIFPWESYSAAPPEDLPLTKVFADDQKYFTSIAEMYKDSTGLKNAPEYKRNGGQLDQWVYFHFGRWSFSAPAWWPPEIKEKPDSTKNGKSDSIKVEKPKIDPKTDSIKNLRRLYKWLQHTGQQNKFLEWQEIKHPDFPHQKVEIGGFTPYTEFVPVVDSLAVRSKRMNRFLILLAQKLPAVVIQNIYVEHLGALVFRIHLVVVNNGYLPSNNKMGEKLKWARSVKAEILLDKTQELKSGRKYHLLESIPGDGAGRQLTWIVSSPPGKKVTVRVGSPMTGTVEKTVTLKE